MMPEAIQGSAESPVEQFNVLTVGAGVVGHAEGTALLEHGHVVAFSDIDQTVLAQPAPRVSRRSP